MSDFKILDVFQQDSHFVVRAEHYNPDGSVWFTENYVWQGREGLSRKRVTNGEGHPMMDNGVPAPMDAAGDPFLPPGRDWVRHPPPRMVDHSILHTIQSTHDRRMVSGFPQGAIDVLTPRVASSTDREGADVLVAAFQHMRGVRV